MPLAAIPETTEPVSAVRDLHLYLERIWQQYFADVPCVNTVEIAYGHPWKRRLGLIRLSLDNSTSFIGINSLLQLARAPECVLITTIAHELTHYAHGFGSPLPRIHKHPHANNVVSRELERRGLGETMRHCNEWVDKRWFSFYQFERKTLPFMAGDTSESFHGGEGGRVSTFHFLC